MPESAPDPLEELDALGCSQPSQLADVGGDDAEFLRALEELKGHFHGQEEEGEPLFDRLATILDASLKRRPTSEDVKLSCSKIKLPSNVPNLTVPTTNSAISKDIARILEKLQEDQTTLLAVLPLWPTQAWFSRALQLLARAPIFLPHHPLVLPQDSSCTHPQARKLVLTDDVIGRSFEDQGLSREVAQFLLHSWRKSTKLQYGPHISR